MNKRIVILIMSICIMSLVLAGIGFAQDTEKKAEEPQKFKVSDDFLNSWKKVGDMTKEIRSFKTEAAVTVAGVRGAEAEDVALKHLYFKGGVRYPNKLELLNALEILVSHIADNPDDPSIAQSKFLVGQISVQIGESEKGLGVFNDIADNHSDSDYAELALAEIEKIENR